MGVFHKCCVFYFLSSDGVNNCVGLVMLGPMVIPEGDGHVGGVHVIKSVLGQVAEKDVFLSCGHLGGSELRVTGVTTLVSNGALAMF
jgi:hypothetical protein